VRDTPILTAERLACGYDEQDVLRGVDLALWPGELLGVIGPNGSGKSTLLRALTGVLPLRGGEARLAGRRLQDWPSRARAQQVAVVPQATLPLFAFTVREMVEMGRHPYLGRFSGWGEEDRQAVEEALALTETIGLQERRVDQLSAGELQRVIIARALAQRPRVLLLDEPTAHLDVGHQLEIFELLTRLNQAQGLSVLCISHDLNLAAEYCHRLILLSEGRVFAEGHPAGVITEQNLRAVYGARVHVGPNPYSGQPQVTLSRTGSQRDGQ